MKKSQLRKIIKESIKELMNEQAVTAVTATGSAGCDNTSQGTCAQTWLQPTGGGYGNWSGNFPNSVNINCSGSPSFNGTEARLDGQVINYVGNRLAINASVEMDTMRNSSDMSSLLSAVDAIVVLSNSGRTHPTKPWKQDVPINKSGKARIIRKMAKRNWAVCMRSECGC
jgi:hypothetical protein